MKKLITVAALVLTFLFTTSFSFAGGKDYNPCYGLAFVAQNNTTETVSVWVECEKGIFWAEVSPGETFGYELAYDEPIGGFPPDWFAEGGEVIIYVNGQKLATKHVKCLANLQNIVVVINPKKHIRSKIGVNVTTQ